MFQTKILIDSLCAKVFHKVQDEREKKFSCYGIAQLYSQVEEHELARKYVSEYLLVQGNSAPAYELLGQSYQALGQKESALKAYKRSFQLDENQNDLVLKICELLIDQDIDEDPSQIPYWVEKAVLKYPNHPVVLKLKEKIVTNNKSDVNELKKLQSEISVNPSDVNLQIRLIKYYVSKNLMEDALKYAMEVESTYTYYQSLIWYECFYDLLTKMKIYKDADSFYWVFLTTASERYVALALAEHGDKAKTIPEVMQILFNFDQDLYEAKSKIDKSYDSMLVMDQMFDHMYGQLNYHLCCFLLRSVKTNVAIWQETRRFCCGLLYTAIHSNIVNRKAIWRFAQHDQIPHWHKEGSYRYSQAGHMLAKYIKNDSRLMKIIIESLEYSGRKSIYCKIFSGRYNEQLIKTSFFMNNPRKKFLWELLTREFEEFDRKTQLIYPDSLHPEIIEPSTSHYQFIKPSDQYIPKELVMRSDHDYKKFIQSLLDNNFTVNPDSVNDQDFVYASIENGHLPIVLQLLQFGINVEMTNPETGLNLLAIACLNNHYEIVQALLQHNVNVNMKIHNNEMSLNKLRSYSSMHVFNRLLSLFFNEDNLSDVTCLHIAVLNSDPNMTRLLLEHGATLSDDPNFFKITCIAIRNNCKEIVSMFLDHGLDITDLGPHGKTLLSLCIRSEIAPDSTYDIVELLLKKGGVTYIQTPGNLFIFKALKEEHYDIAQLFLDYHANVEYVSEYKETLLHAALQNNMNENFMRTLLNLNLDVDAVDNLGLTPLLAACNFSYSNQLENVRALLEHNPTINCTDEDLWTPLHFAVSGYDLEFITVLLERGANPNVSDANGRTPLHIISLTRCEEAPKIIELLLQYNAKIDAVDEDGRTPLCIACHYGHSLAVKCLLENNANVNHIDAENLTPLYIAAQHCSSHPEVVSMLLKHEIKVDCIDQLGNSVVHLIVDHNQVQLVKSLANTLINFDFVNKKGNTPLHIAVKKNLVDMTASLIKYGSDINVVDTENETPLQKAVNTISFPVDVSSRFERLQCWKNHQIIINTLKIQVVKLKLANLEVHDQNLNLVYKPKDDITKYFQYFDEYDSDDENLNHQQDFKGYQPKLEKDCRREIKAMRMENISRTSSTVNISLLDLLKKDYHHLIRFIQNEGIQKILEMEIYERMFPLYIDIIRSRFRIVKFRYELMNPAIECFKKNISKRLLDDCIDRVLSYFNIEQLQTFIEIHMSSNS